MQIASFYNNKGGVAKTTSTMLIGELLATAGFPTLILDSDTQGDLSVNTYGIPKDAPGLAEVLEKPERLEEVLHETRVKDLWLIPPGNNLDEICQQWDVRKQLRAKCDVLLTTIRERLSGSFDICLIDNPPQKLGRTVYCSEISDRIVLPVESENAAFKATIRTYFEMRSFFPNWGKQDISILVTKHKKTRSLANAHVKSYQDWVWAEKASYENLNPGKNLKLRLLDSVIPDSAEVEKSKHAGSNLFLSHFSSDICKAYIAATEELLPSLGSIKDRIQALVEERKKQNLEKNILPNAFKKKAPSMATAEEG